MPTLSVELRCGLGNQLFQIAVAYAFSKDNNFNLVFPESTSNYREDRPSIWEKYLDCTEFKNTIISMQDFTKIDWFIISEPHFKYAPITIPVTNLPFYKLYGYFQSSLYFSRYSNEIRDILDKYINSQTLSKNIIIYCKTRRDVDKINKELNDNGYLSQAYHAGLTNTEREEVQNKFTNDLLNRYLKIDT
jgi:hypothetical protein